MPEALQAFLAAVYADCAAGHPRKGIDRVFVRFDDLLHAGDRATCAEILAAVEVEKLDPMVALGFLTITACVAHDLPTHAAFVARLRPWLVATIGTDRTEALIRPRIPSPVRYEREASNDDSPF